MSAAIRNPLPLWGLYFLLLVAMFATPLSNLSFLLWIIAPLLQAMLPVLQQHLGKDTGGRRYFVVTLDEDEAPVVEEKEVTAN